MNTHPTNTQVGGWGLWPMIVPIGVGVFVAVVAVVCMCLWCVGFLALVCVWWEFFVPEYLKCLGTSGFIFPNILLESETPKFQPNSGTKSTYSTWVTLTTQLVEKMLQVFQIRGSMFFIVVQAGIPCCTQINDDNFI